VLIYFDNELQNRILPRFQYAVRERGYLFLGRSESMLARTRRFTPIDFKWRVFNRITPPDLIGKPLVGEADPSGRRVPVQITRRDALTATRLQSVVDGTPVAIIVIDPADTIVVWNPAAEALFDTSADGTIGRKFRDLDISYRIDNLRSRVEEVKATETRVSLDDVTFSSRSGDVVHVSFNVVPLYDDRRRLSGVMLCASDVTEMAQLREELNRIGEQSATANEELQSTNEELETTNEELQSTNEELETTNEELQSTNEELETTVEELQAINSELGTLNSELEKRSEELATADVLQATVLDAVDGAVIVLDTDSVVRTWNLAASRMWGLKAHDAISHPFAVLPIGDVATKSAAAIHDALVRRKRSTVDDITFTLPGAIEQRTSLHCTPLIAGDGRLLGVVLLTQSTSARS
jgi:two-component system CheB/CheR fusion protein